MVHGYPIKVDEYILAKVMGRGTKDMFAWRIYLDHVSENILDRIDFSHSDIEIQFLKERGHQRRYLNDSLSRGSQGYTIDYFFHSNTQLISSEPTLQNQLQHS